MLEPVNSTLDAFNIPLCKRALPAISPAIEPDAFMPSVISTAKDPSAFEISTPSPVAIRIDPLLALIVPEFVTDFPPSTIRSASIKPSFFTDPLRLGYRSRFSIKSLSKISPPITCKCRAWITDPSPKINPPGAAK